MSASDVVTIDGGMMEGGGQILRMGTAFSCLLKIPIYVNNIRAGRNNPGLRPQHLSGLQLVRDLCGGKLLKDQVSSTEITFYPAAIQAGSFIADTKTAGSVGLLFQVALPCLLYGRGSSHLTIKGGTNADMAPQIDYTTMVFQPIVKKFGVTFDCAIKRRGYYPKGGGIVEIRVMPVKSITPVEITDVGEITKITGLSFVAGALPPKVANIMAQEASSFLKRLYPNIPIKIDAVKEPEGSAIGTGSGIVIMAETSTGCRLAGSGLGKKGETAEKIGRSAAEMLSRNIKAGGCVDEYLQDQLIIFMALADGKSRVRSGPITLHTETAIHVAHLLTKAKFEIKPIPDSEAVIIECEGIGLINKQI